MKISSHLVGLITVACLASACGKDKAEPMGTISGEVRILDEFGREVVDRSGIKITAASSSIQTNPTGQYNLKTSAGTQTIAFEKPYHGTYKLLNKQLAGAVQQPLITLGTQPLHGILGIVVKAGYNAIHVSGLTADVNYVGQPPRKHRLFLNGGPVSPKEYTLTTIGETNVSYNEFFDVITFDQLQAAGLLPGQQIQIRAYSDNIFADTYIDPETKRTIYPALSSSGSNYITFSY